MKSYTTLSTEFRSLFRQFRESAFRLETLQQYLAPSESTPYRDFLAGRERYTDPKHQEWTDLIRDNVRQGKAMSRVHVVIEPPSDYVRFELLWPYADNRRSGEEIGIIPVAPNDWPQLLPHQDFWLFDGQTAAVMTYDADGMFLEATLTDAVGEIEQFLKWRDAALAACIPYESYVSRLMKPKAS